MSIDKKIIKNPIVIIAAIGIIAFLIALLSGVGGTQRPQKGFNGQNFEQQNSGENGRNIDGATSQFIRGEIKTLQERTQELETTKAEQAETIEEIKTLLEETKKKADDNRAYLKLIYKETQDLKTQIKGLGQGYNLPLQNNKDQELIQPTRPINPFIDTQALPLRAP